MRAIGDHMFDGILLEDVVTSEPEAPVSDQETLNALIVLGCVAL